MTRLRRNGALTCLAVLAAAFVLPRAGAAQERRPDFLFKRPVLRVTVRTGVSVPRARSDVFDFTRQQLTVDRTDFASLVWGGEVAVRATERLDVVLGFDVASRGVRSEFRDWVGTDDLPIRQESRFLRVPVTIGVKGYLFERGRRLGRFAWIPARWSPYLGTAVGWIWYEFEQSGEFVDFETLDIFTDTFRSADRTGTVQVLAGADVSLGPRLVLTAEGRYGWARAPMSSDFVGFDDIDLAGFQATIGLSFRF